MVKKKTRKVKGRRQKYTKKTKFSELIKNPRAAEILMQKGMYCFGCPMAPDETLEQGCKVHGMTDAKIKKLIDKLNKK